MMYDHNGARWWGGVANLVCFSFVFGHGPIPMGEG
jgi:hypothetical protein